LMLAKETVRRLGGPALERVAGGTVYTGYFTRLCPTSAAPRECEFECAPEWPEL
jgi:hypothetical protein